MNGPTYRTSARIEIDREALTAGARAMRLSHAKEKTARVAVGRKVRGVYGDVCKLPVYDALEEVRRSRDRPPRVDYAGIEVIRSLPVGGEVPEERRLQQGAATTVLAPPPGHVIRAPDLHAQDARRA